MGGDRPAKGASVTPFGFGHGRERDPRLPPGQYDTGSSFPVLTAEVSPDNAKTWNWAAAHARPASSYEGDIHCVTTWSKLGTSFGGVSLDAFLAETGVSPQATHVVAWSHTGYTTNLPLAEVTGGKAWIVWDHEGKPLPAQHGGPVRMLVPHLYFWKSAKWIGGLRLLDHDEPGFWEVRGYHSLGDPWKEQRYDGDD
jgi:DMSO/TMAO reductase YedYZ molybdopterin-dependent catalytic subunit